jgi:hypothetical protein
MDANKNIDDYLKMTGQTEQYLFGGEFAFGHEFIVMELIPKALEQHKKIIWRDEPNVGLDAMSYSLEEF